MLRITVEVSVIPKRQFCTRSGWPALERHFRNMQRRCVISFDNRLTQ